MQGQSEGQLEDGQRGAEPLPAEAERGPQEAARHHGPQNQVKKKVSTLEELFSHDDQFIPCRHRDCLEDPDESTGTCSLKLFPEENSWHYITVTPTRPDRKIEFAINVVITGMTLSI